MTRRTRTAMCGVAAVSVLLATSLAARADEASDAKSPANKKAEDNVIDGFAASIKTNDKLDDAQREALIALIDEQRKDEDNRHATVTDALTTIYPEFGAALANLADEKTDEAIAALKKQSESSDAYLAADASYYLARAHTMLEQFDKAMPLLKELGAGKLADKTLYSGNVQFLLGASHARLLDRENALKALSKFVEDFPDAPERHRVAALRQIEDLVRLKHGQGTLIDVQDRMDFSRWKLSREDSGRRTRTEQDKIVAMLDRLIKEAEEQEGGT